MKVTLTHTAIPGVTGVRMNLEIGVVKWSAGRTGEFPRDILAH